MKKRWWIIVVVVVLLAVVAYFLYPVVAGRSAAANSALETSVVRRGTMQVTVKATGSVVPHSELSLSMPTGGQVSAVLVGEGTAVVAGQPLLRLDTADLELQLAQAKASLDLAEANLAKTLAKARPEDVQVSRSNLTQAEANLQEQTQTLAAATEQARLSWVQAANNLRDAQAKYSEIYWSNLNLQQKLADIGQTLPQVDIDNEAAAWHAVENASAAMEQARLSYEQAQQRQASTIQTAQAQVTSAQAALDKLVNGPTSEDVAVAQASVQQARLSVEQAQAQLDKASLTAPSDGTVTAVNVQVGQWVSAGQSVVVLSDLAHLEVDVNLDETDVAQVAAGQVVQVQLDAFPSAGLSGKVTQIALTSLTQAGVVLYPVTISLDQTQVPVRAGMTAEATIVIASKENTLIVPLRSVQVQGQQAYVQRVKDGKTERVAVTLGLRTDTQVEVTSGLSEGDVIAAVPGASGTARSSSGSFLGLFGGRP